MASKKKTSKSGFNSTSRGDTSVKSSFKGDSGADELERLVQGLNGANAMNNPFALPGSPGGAGGIGRNAQTFGGGGRLPIQNRFPQLGYGNMGTTVNSVTGKPVGMTGGRPTGFDALENYADENQKAFDEAKAKNEERYLQLLEEYGAQRGDTADRLGSAIDDIDARYEANQKDMDTLHRTARKDAGKRYGNRTKEVSKRTDGNKRELDRDYTARQKEAMARLRGAGEQEATDIRQSSKATQSAVDQNLVNRGFANSGVAETLRMGVGRERNADLARLGERLRGEEQNVFGRMSGERLAALERANGLGLNAYMAASGDEAGALTGLDMNQLGALERAFMSQTNAAERGLGNLNNALTRIDERRQGTIENRTDSYPDYGPLLNMAQQAGMGGGYGNPAFSNVPSMGGQGQQGQPKAPQGRMAATNNFKRPKFQEGFKGSQAVSPSGSPRPGEVVRGPSAPTMPSGPSLMGAPDLQQQIAAWRAGAGQQQQPNYGQVGGGINAKPVTTTPVQQRPVTQQQVYKKPITYR